MRPLVLIGQMEKGKAMRLSFLASSMGICVREIAPGEAGCTLGMLCGLDPLQARAGVLSREMMVMAFFPEPLMDAWLKAMRNTGDTVALKAVLTPYNRLWTAQKLAGELLAEHRAFQAKEKNV